MRKSIAVVALLAAGAAWGAEKPLPVQVTNPSVRVQDTDAGKYTHVDQKPGRVVNLEIYVTGSYRIDPASGDPESTQYQVPDDFVLVLTDLEGIISCTPDNVASYSLRQRKPFIAGSYERDFNTLVCPSTSYASFDRHFTTGLLFGAGSQIFLDDPSGTFPQAVLGQGYLVPAD